MASRARLPLFVGGCALLGALAWWRASERPAPAPAASPARATAVAKSLPPPEPLPVVPPGRDPLEFARDALRREPPELGALAFLEARPEALDLLLDYAGPSWPLDVRFAALRRLGPRELSEAQLRALARLFDAEQDHDLKSAILLAAGSSRHPAAGDLGEPGSRRPTSLCAPPP